MTPHEEDVIFIIFFLWYDTGERTPKSTDRQEMHYTMSAINEILRTDIATISLSHYASEDTVVCGHTIPKGTISYF